MNTNGSFTTSPTTIRKYNDLAAKMPDKLKEMQALFQKEAADTPGLTAG